MIWNKKGQWASTLVKLVIILTIIVVTIMLINRVRETFDDTVGNCVKRAGICKYPCIPQAGEEVIGLADDYCEDTYGDENLVCCTSKEIRASLKNNILPIGSREITIEKLTADKLLTSGDEISLIVGAPEIFTIKIQGEAAAEKHDNCTVSVVDTATNTRLPYEEKTWSRGVESFDVYVMDFNFGGNVENQRRTIACHEFTSSNYPNDVAEGGKKLMISLPDSGTLDRELQLVVSQKGEGDQVYRAIFPIEMREIFSDVSIIITNRDGDRLKTRPYRDGEDIGDLLAGQAYVFNIDFSENYQKPHNMCEFTIVDEDTHEAVGFVYSTPESSGGIVSRYQNTIKRECIRLANEPIGLVPEPKHEGKKLSLRFNIYSKPGFKDGDEYVEYLMSANKFGINVQNRIGIRVDKPNTWTKKVKIDVTCGYPACDTIAYGTLLPGSDVSQCSNLANLEKPHQGEDDLRLVGFDSDNKATIEFDDIGDVARNSGTGVINSPVCMHITIDQRDVIIFNSDVIKMDYRGPGLARELEKDEASERNLIAVCQDSDGQEIRRGLASGCAELRSYVTGGIKKADATEDGWGSLLKKIVDIKSLGVVDDLTNFRVLNENFGGLISFECSIPDLSNPRRDPIYKTTKSFPAEDAITKRVKINTEGYAYGQICMYAVDAQGNPSVKEGRPYAIGPIRFMDLEGLQEKVKEKMTQELFDFQGKIIAPKSPEEEEIQAVEEDGVRQ